MKQYFTLLFLFPFTPAFSQNISHQLGAKAAAMAYTTSTQDDSWSLFNNPAGLGTDSAETIALFTFENRFAIEELNVMGAGIVEGLPLGALGLSVFKFGDDLYNEQSISAVYANELGIASLGIRVNYLRYFIDGFGDAGIITIDFGGLARVTDQLFFGAYIRNINQARASTLEDERSPTLLNAGLSFRPTNKIIMNVEAEKDIDYEANVRVGLQYKFLKKFSVRTGVKTIPFTQYFGLGFSTLKLNIDYALTREQVLGLVHQASLSYKLRHRP